MMRSLCLHRFPAGRQIPRRLTPTAVLRYSTTTVAATSTSPPAAKPTQPGKAEGEPIPSTTKSRDSGNNSAARSTAGPQEDEVAKMKAAFGEREDGGESSIEYEDGVATSMKRSVRNNMFRYI